MGFWKKLGKIAAIAAPIAAAPFTGGASLALIGAGSGALGGLLGGGGWKGALMGGGLGSLAGLGGGALKGMGGFGKALGSKAGQAALAGGTTLAKGALGGMGKPQQQAGNPYRYRTPDYVNVGAGGAGQQGYLNPIGLEAPRRTGLAGMGTRNYGNA
jgi:hypothetical protein